MIDYAITAKELVSKLGGEKNILKVTHCMTRLRFNLKDESIVNDEEVKAVKGVMGVMKKGGQYQVIIGNNVQICYRELIKLGNFSGDAGVQETRDKEKMSVGRFFNRLLDVISGSMAPLLPALIGGGMIKLLIIILGLFHIDSTSTTMRILAIIGDAPFYFLPVLLAYTASKKFNCNTGLSIAVAAVLIYPDFITLLGGGGVNFLRIPVISASYSSSVIPALLSTWALSWIERWVDKITPSWTKTIIKPMLILLIAAPVAFLLLGPIGTIAGDALAAALGWMQAKVGWLTMAIAAGFMPFIIMTGMHYAFLPSATYALTEAGGGADPFLIPAMLCSNIAQGAATLAVAIKSKNKEMKSVASASSASAFFGGITEPAMYGVTLKLKKPMLAACIGGGLAGLFTGIVGLKCYSMATPSLIGVIAFVSPEGVKNIIFAIIAVLISAIVTFVLTLIFGFKDPVDEEGTTDATDTKGDNDKSVPALPFTPVKGKIIPLSEVNDEAFSTGILGEGFAVIPDEGRVYAPFDGVVENIFDTKHAIGLKSDEGMELLIHIGLETVALNGEGFTAHVSCGDRVKQGDVLIEFDKDLLESKGLDITTPVVFTS